MPVQDLLINLPYAEGAVEPADRIEAGQIDPQKITELAERIKAGNYTLAGNEDLIPCLCMDCRALTNGEATLGPKAAGGTMTLVVADALTYDSYRHKNDDAAQHKLRLFSELQQSGFKPGGHVPAGFPDNLTGGCGAEGKLDSDSPDKPSIFKFIVKNSKAIFDTLIALGYEIDSDLEESIIDNTRRLITQKYASNGTELAKVGMSIAPENNVQLEDGPQLAVLAAIMTKKGAYLDQKRIRQDYGPDYQVFEIEPWAIRNGAKVTSISEKEEHDREIAGMVFQVAATGVIGGAGLGIVVV
ncbi:MAG TPA: hypothetical protein VFN51_03145 [Candidatus Saccharimonadales bacterium]|nr:hypothetical protein [Candidatus Saccharimonadales bacterium]